ncbi:MAG: FAD-dependent oxidoreductase, partial [Alphaproteobacteria bacterium]|nr:FAD-dependent oxidoreductase [Alphaproteobacteria bacterium]
IASSKDRWSEIKRTATTARSFGFELHLMTPAEAKQAFPYITTDGVEGAAFVPSDGYVDPSSLTQALAKGARAGGVRFHEGVRVTGFALRDGRVTSVRTDQGTIACEIVVNAAGIWARDIGAMAGAAIPAAAVEHQYMVTEKLKDVPRSLPSLRDPDKNFYLKPEVGGFAIGGWESDTRPFGAKGVPFDFGRELFPGNFDRFEAIVVPATERLPVLNEIGIKTLINGPIPISPDGEPILGLAPGLDNFFVACGFTSGIAAAGGAGRAMAHWILHGDPEFDLWTFDIRRFGPHHAGTTYLHERAVEAYHRYYLIHWPGEEMRTGRGGRRSPVHHILAAKGAVFGSRFGWERPLWFRAAGIAATEAPSFEGQPGWAAAVAREHKATREAATLFDQTSFSKFELSGPGATKLLQRLAANDVDRPPGALIYTQLCNERGGIEADLTIMRLAADRYYIVTGSGFGVRDGGWIARHMPRDGSVALADVTSARAVLNLCGPRARAVLAQVTDADLSSTTFPYMSMQEIRIGYAPVRAARVTYVGELGWELHMPVEYAQHVYERIEEAGRPHGLIDAGYKAIDGLRMEKRYLYWGSDITPDTTPYEAGLGFCVALGKGEFIGRAALARAKAEPPARKLCLFLVDGGTALHGSEAILCDGKVVGVTASAAYGHTVGKWIATGYVPADAAKSADFEIEAFARRLKATRIDKALYDPERRKILA